TRCLSDWSSDVCSSDLKMFNGAIGDRLDRQFQDKYKLKVLCFYDYGFRHFWNNRRPIAAPKDLRGLKMRVQPAKVFADTINGLRSEERRVGKESRCRWA